MAPPQKNMTKTKKQASKKADSKEKATEKSNISARAASPSYTRSTSKSPAVSPKTTPSKLQNSPNQKETQNRRGPNGAFGKYTFGPETAGWAMGTGQGIRIDYPLRERGGTVVPEPETEERMKELARGGSGKA